MSVIETIKSYLSTDGEKDIRTALHDDHLRIRELVSDMSQATTAARRIAGFEALKPLLTAHARTEERVVYEALVKVRGSAQSRDLGNEGFVEHSLVDVLLERLGKTSLAGTDAWKAHAIVLKELLDHHVKEEESEIFDALGKHFSDERLAEMARAFQAGKAKLVDELVRA